MTKLLKILDKYVENVLNKKLIYSKSYERLEDTDNSIYLKLDDKSYSEKSIPDLDISFPLRKGSSDKAWLYNLPYNNRHSFKRSQVMGDSELMNEMKRVFGDGNYVCSGIFHMLPGGTCPWHTNSNNKEGERIYLVWAKEHNKSFFRYKDIKTGEMITEWEIKGWQVNRFTPTNRPPYVWHCVASETDRISIGFNKLK